MVISIDAVFARILIGLSAAIIFALGSMHLVLTYRGVKLSPRDADLKTAMQNDSPIISRQTSMWKAWIGFNASHSLGAMLFGLIYGYFAVMEPGLLFGSGYLLAVGICMLAALLLLGKRYWFNVPFTGILIALCCFTGGVAIWHT